MATLVTVSVEDVTAREISRLHGGEYEDDIASCSLLKYTDAPDVRTAPIIAPRGKADRLPCI
jgi:hypothetical protein